MEYVESFNLFGTEVSQIPCIRGKGEPTTATVGAVGCQYMNTDNGNLYKCTAVVEGACTWVKIGDGGTGGGEPGFSPIAKVEQTEDGATITVTDANGTTTAAVKNGDTPKKGVDYWTDADKAEMVNAVLAALPDGDEVAY